MWFVVAVDFNCCRRSIAQILIGFVGGFLAKDAYAVCHIRRRRRSRRRRQRSGTGARADSDSDSDSEAEAESEADTDAFVLRLQKLITIS